MWPGFHVVAAHATHLSCSCSHSRTHTFSLTHHSVSRLALAHTLQTLVSRLRFQLAPVFALLARNAILETVREWMLEQGVTRAGDLMRVSEWSVEVEARGWGRQTEKLSEY